MEIRKTRQNDISEISKLCEICFGNPMGEEHYTWLYFHNNEFNSYVMLDKGKIIAHQAIIARKYSYLGQTMVIGLSSGSMILPEYQKTGEFYYILKESIDKFKGGMIVGFPNENSHGIMRKIFNYNCISQNLYRMELKCKPNKIIDCVEDLLQRLDLDWRVERHPFYQYKKIQKGKCTVIYKEYLENSIDILYTNVINNDFVEILTGFSPRYSFVNIINVSGAQLEKIGFMQMKGNEFVYKSYGNKNNDFDFPCQMVDSDIY